MKTIFVLITLYGGHFLPGYEGSEQPYFAEWTQCDLASIARERAEKAAEQKAGRNPNIITVICVPSKPGR
jgi:hypothetical protein